MALGGLDLPICAAAMSLAKSAGESENRGIAWTGLLLACGIGNDGIDRDVQFVDNLVAGNCSQATDAVPRIASQPAESCGEKTRREWRIGAI